MGRKLGKAEKCEEWKRRGKQRMKKGRSERAKSKGVGGGGVVRNKGQQGEVISKGGLNKGGHRVRWMHRKPASSSSFLFRPHLFLIFQSKDIIS